MASNNVNLGLGPYSNGDKRNYEKGRLQSIDKNSNKTNNAKNEKVSPKEFINMSDLQAYNPLNANAYRKKEYKKYKIKPKIEKTFKYRAIPNELIDFSNLQPHGSTNAKIYRENQFIKYADNSKKPKLTKEEQVAKYNERKKAKYNAVKKRCDDQNELDYIAKVANEKKRLEEENAKNGKNRLLNILNINSDKNLSEIDKLVNQIFIVPINKNIKSLGITIHCKFIHKIIKETMAYFVENIFQYNTEVKEGWLQLMYTLTNLNYNKKNMLNYKSYTEAVYKRRLLEKSNRDNHIETLQNTIGKGLKLLGSLAGKVANRTALGLSITDKMNEHYNNKIKSNKTNNYYTSLEANFSENRDKIFEKIQREISSFLDAWPEYYNQISMVIMSLILLHKLQTKKDFSTFDECFLTKEDVEQYLQNPPQINNSLLQNAKNANTNRKIKKSNDTINIINDYLGNNNDARTHVPPDILKSPGPPQYIKSTSINKDLINRTLDTGNATNFELNIEIFNLNLFLLYTYYICSKYAKYFSIINKKTQGSTVEFGLSNYFEDLDKKCTQKDANIIQYNENLKASQAPNVKTK